MPMTRAFPARDTGTPTYDGLPLRDYVSVLEMLNPMHRLWSDGRWNKITLAHGCYWKKCSFCDVSLDYIGRYDRPAADIVVQRIVDAWMSFPYLAIILSLMAVLGPGLLNLILTLSLLIAAGGARVIRSAALSVMQNPYLEAARAMGSGHLRIVLRYVLPNVMATIMILATIGLGGVILAESSLSFLGFGVPPPYPSWGAMLSGSGRSYMYRAPWMAIWPGLAISLAVFGFNMLGDALRDVLDPRLRGR